MEIIKKANRVIYKVSGETISIPSRMYPLESDSFQCFDADNTSEIVDERIIAIFDSINPEVGRCFTNAENLCTALQKEGYPAEQYVGWLFMGNELPVHHSFVVLDGHILDLSISLKSEDFEKLDSITVKCKTKDEARNIYCKKSSCRIISAVFLAWLMRHIITSEPKGQEKME